MEHCFPGQAQVAQKSCM